MEIRIAKMLKELRNNKGNRQEDLALYLGISVQAVSKWERGEGMPDITLLPKISAFYGISVDTLLGVDDIAKAARIKDITDQYNNIRRCAPQKDGLLTVEHNIDEGIALIRNAVHEFPDHWFFLQLLASDLWWKGKNSSEDSQALLDEAEELCERILYKCNEDRWRHCANSILCMIYNDSGQKKKALDIAYQSPALVDSLEWKLSKIYKGEELIKQLDSNIRELTRLLYMSVVRLQDNGGKFICDDAISIQLDTVNRAMRTL